MKIYIDNDHLPEDKKKRPTAEEEDEGHDGSNQHHCTQLLCLFYHLERVKVTLVTVGSALGSVLASGRRRVM